MSVTNKRNKNVFDKKYNIDQILDIPEKKFMKIWNEFDINDIRKYEKMEEYNFDKKFTIIVEELSKPTKQNLVKYLVCKKWLRFDGIYQDYIGHVAYYCDIYFRLYELKDKRIKYVIIDTGYMWFLPKIVLGETAATESNKEWIDYNGKFTKRAKKFMRRSNLCILSNYNNSNLDEHIVDEIKDMKTVIKWNDKKNVDRSALLKVNSIEEAFDCANDLSKTGYCHFGQGSEGPESVDYYPEFCLLTIYYSTDGSQLMVNK